MDRGVVDLLTAIRRAPWSTLESTLVTNGASNGLEWFANLLLHDAAFVAALKNDADQVVCTADQAIDTDGHGMSATAEAGSAKSMRTTGTSMTKPVMVSWQSQTARALYEISTAAQTESMALSMVDSSTTMGSNVRTANASTSHYLVFGIGLVNTEVQTEVSGDIVPVSAYHHRTRSAWRLRKARKADFSWV